jgi:ankyrin repeat protein
MRKDSQWPHFETMNGEEEHKLPFPEECIINETIPGHDTDKEIENILSKRHIYDVNSLNEFGHTPLSTAAYAGSIKFVKLLVEIGADVTFKDSDGWTAMHFATATKNYEIAKFLMSVGADTKELTNDGQKPLDFVKDKNTRTFLTKYGERCVMSNLRTSYC